MNYFWYPLILLKKFPKIHKQNIEPSDYLFGPNGDPMDQRRHYAGAREQVPGRAGDEGPHPSAGTVAARASGAQSGRTGAAVPEGPTCFFFL